MTTNYNAHTAVNPSEDLLAMLPAISVIFPNQILTLKNLQTS